MILLKLKRKKMVGKKRKEYSVDINEINPPDHEIENREKQYKKEQEEIEKI